MGFSHDIAAMYVENVQSIKVLWCDNDFLSNNTTTADYDHDSDVSSLWFG